MRYRSVFVLLLAVAAPTGLAASCSDDSETTTTTPTAAGGSGAVGASSPSSGGTGGVGGATGGTAGSTSSAQGGYVPQISECQGQVYQCGDTVDNDDDGKIDMVDEHCTGPCDNTEDSFKIGIPGSRGSGCIVDCYWDNDSGHGNDDCYWNHKCDQHEMPPDYYPEPWLADMCAYDPGANTPGTGASCAELDATQSQECFDICGPITPNGCDCFGCCEYPPGMGSYVWLGSLGVNEDTECTVAELGNPAVCHPCDPVDACLNDCGVCEYCFGKDTLPPECFDPDGGGGQECPPDFFVECDPQNPVCPTTDYCQNGCFCLQGCCVPNPP